jgi:hypothetical protein
MFLNNLKILIKNMTDKNTSEKQAKNASGVGFKGAIVDVKKIVSPIGSEKQDSKKQAMKEYGFNIGAATNIRCHDYQAILLHTNRDELLDMDMASSVLDNCPLAMANINIVNKPLLIYQLEYLQKYGIHDIIITVEKKFAHKIEKYIKNQF